MPVPIIERQRALSRVGEIRIGGEKPGRGAGKKLEAFRLTSQHKDIIERAAGLYGGQPKAWQSPTGEAWQLYTTAASLPVLLIVGYSLKQTYELWEGASKCTRRCDGEHEDYSEGPCICNTEGVDKCDVITRLMVVLPETGTSLGWQLRSTGENAARELSGAMMLAEEMAAGRAFVPAILRLTQRRSLVNAQTVRYVVPVLDFNLVAEAARQLPGANQEIEAASAWKPVAQLPMTGVSVEEGLALAEQGSKPRTRNGKEAAPIPDGDDFGFGDAPVPVPDDEPAEPSATEKETPAPTAGGPNLTQAQAKKLNVLVGKLRDNNHITIEQLYAALAKSRNIDTDTMAQVLDGARDDQGELHWGPLRDSLSKAEASDLIERLGKLEANIQAAAAAS